VSKAWNIEHQMALLSEIFNAIDEHSVPLHLAVRLTPETLNQLWAYMMWAWDIDVLMAIRPVGLMQVAMSAAELIAERMEHTTEHWLERAQAVIAGQEPPRVLDDYIRTCAEWMHHGSSEGADRWKVIQRALIMSRNYAEQRATGNADPARWRLVVAEAFGILFRAKDLLPAVAFEGVRRELDALGPPTLEDIMAAAERPR
jgi:hypothetical protein